MSVQKFNPRVISEEPVPFTMVPNNVINLIDDPTAGWIWLYLQHKSSDWQVIKSFVKRRFKIGDDKVKRIFAYLHKVHLLEYVRVRNEKGHMVKTDIRILNGSKFKPLQSNVEQLSTPLKSTGVKTTPLENHTCGSGGLLKKDNTKEINIKNLSASGDAQPQLGFDDYWKVVPVKKNKKRAQHIWKVMKLDRLAKKIIDHVKENILHDAQWKDKQYIPQPDTYLRGAQWEDEIIKSIPQDNLPRFKPMCEQPRPQLTDWTKERLEKEAYAISTNKPANLDGDATVKAKRFLEEARKSIGQR